MTVHRSRGLVRFSETDASGRFHFTSPLCWVENSEHELYRAAGVPAGRFPRRTVTATFEGPLADGDDYVVELEVRKLGSSSVTYGWRIVADERVAVTGSHTVVHVDESGRPAPVPDTLRAMLNALTAEAS